jgi:hypothetical protein
MVTVPVIEFTGAFDLAAIIREPERWSLYDDFIQAADQTGFDGSGAIVIRRAAFEEAGGFTVEISAAEDHDLFLRLGAKPKYVRMHAPSGLAYRRHETGITKNLDALARGVAFLAGSEKAGRYPGGNTRIGQRITYITRSLRPVAVQCIKRSKPREGWALYRTAFYWHLRLRRWRFLAGFVLLALKFRFRGVPRGSA